MKCAHSLRSKRAHYRQEAAEAAEVSSDISLANLTARQWPRGKHQHTGSVFHSQWNTNQAAGLLPPLAFAVGLGGEKKATHEPNTISFSVWLISWSTERHTSQ